MFYTPCEFGGLSNIYIYMIIVLSSSLLRLQSCYSNVVATPLCTTLEFSDRALAHWSPNSLCSGQLSSRHSFQPIASGGKRESAPFLPMLPHLSRPFHVYWACDLCPHMDIRRALVWLCDTAVHPSHRMSVVFHALWPRGPLLDGSPPARRATWITPRRCDGVAHPCSEWAGPERGVHIVHLPTDDRCAEGTVHRLERGFEVPLSHTALRWLVGWQRDIGFGVSARSKRHALIAPCCSRCWRPQHGSTSYPGKQCWNTGLTSAEHPS